MQTFWDHYTEIMSDPAHMMAEVSFMLIVDVLFLGLIWPLMRKIINGVVDRRVAEEHKILDAEHGVDHDTATGQPDETTSVTETAA